MFNANELALFLMDSIAEGILIFDDQLKIVYSNAQAEEMLRLSHEDVLSKTSDDLANGTFQPLLMQSRETLKKIKHPFTLNSQHFQSTLVTFKGRETEKPHSIVLLSKSSVPPLPFVDEPLPAIVKEDVISSLFFEKLMTNIQPLAEAKNIALDLFLEDSLDRIYVHPKDMAFALMSLLSRAINFSDKGKINLMIRERDTGNSDIVRIENPEETIKPDQHEAMVQSFIKGTDKAKNIIEAHGGKFWLETEQGFAMVFTIPKHLEAML